MSARIATLSRIALLIGVTASFIGCRAATDTKTDELIDWKISWQPSTAHVDNTPITTQPSYELEMSEGEGSQGPWKMVWSGQATTASFKAPPGHRCFRAVTIEDGTRSAPSQINCATKQADESPIRQAERDS